jgi:IS1 family transposase/transposase-like protein
MVVSVCQHELTKKHGRDRKGHPRVRCLLCGKTVTVVNRPLGDMRTSVKDAALVLGMLLEGLSIRSVERLTGMHRDTIGELILIVGDNCERFLAAKVKGVACDDVQCDEIWSFVGCKERTRHRARYTGDEGHSWTWIAVERNTKLVLAHHVGQRDNESGDVFLRKLETATAGRFQLSTDGLGVYSLSVPFTFRGRVDFGQLVKSFSGGTQTGRYSPAKIIKAEKRARYGEPDHERICTSHVERLNLTLRMTMRRFTRLTNAYSKSLKHHRAMQAVFFTYYNFCRVHETLKQTPAMASGLADKAWTVRQLIEAAASE